MSQYTLGSNTCSSFLKSSRTADDNKNVNSRQMASTLNLLVRVFLIWFFWMWRFIKIIPITGSRDHCVQTQTVEMNPRATHSRYLHPYLYLHLIMHVHKNTRNIMVVSNREHFHEFVFCFVFNLVYLYCLFCSLSNVYLSSQLTWSVSTIRGDHMFIYILY